MKQGVWATIALVILLGNVSMAQDLGSGQAVGTGSNVKPPILNKVGIDQRIGAIVPAGLVFKDADGKTVRLGDYFGKRPMVLVLVYYQCPMLCTLVLNDLLHTMCKMTDTVGTDYDVLTVSFDPRDTPELAKSKKKNYLAQYDRPGAAGGWHFLTGQQESISKLAEAVGFRYTWDPQEKVFVHASGIIVLTPQGKISRYFFGVNYAPDDLRLALTEASGGHTGGIVDSILLYCCYYNPVTGKYNVAISRFLKVGGAVMMLGLGAFVGVTLRRGRKGVGSA
jgi:protein SCO1